MTEAAAAGGFRQLAAQCEVVELSHTWFAGMPVSPVHPPYVFSLLRRHGDQPRDDGSCTANDLVVMCTHTGTHVDALGHVSRDGLLHGDLDAGQTQRGGTGLKQLDAGQIGWAQRWPDPVAFVSAAEGKPGPGGAGADWLAARQVRATGSDTLVYEVVRPGVNVRPVHVRLLAEAGVFLMEAMNLEELARRRRYAFTFVLAPLRLAGATGSPVAPLALRPRPGSPQHD